MRSLGAHGLFLILSLLASLPSEAALSVRWEEGRGLLLEGSPEEIRSEAEALSFATGRACHPVPAGCDDFGCRVEATSCLPEKFREMQGKTFEVQGPNCFATALKMTGHVPTFRGVDVGEFEAYATLACREVSEPQAGDIGVFAAPQGFGAVHAYVYLSPATAFEKPGVDYQGKTPVSLRDRGAIEYRVIATPECRRYSANPADCFNRHFYLRCQKPVEPAGLWLKEVQRKVLKLELDIARLLEVAAFESREREKVRQLREEFRRIGRDLAEKQETEVQDPLWRRYMSARQTSLEKQIQFLEMK